MSHEEVIKKITFDFEITPKSRYFQWRGFLYSEIEVLPIDLRPSQKIVMSSDGSVVRHTSRQLTHDETAVMNNAVKAINKALEMGLPQVVATHLPDGWRIKLRENSRIHHKIRPYKGGRGKMYGGANHNLATTAKVEAMYQVVIEAAKAKGLSKSDLLEKWVKAAYKGIKNA